MSSHKARTKRYLFWLALVASLCCLWIARRAILRQVALGLVVCDAECTADAVWINASRGIHPDLDQCYERVAARAAAHAGPTDTTVLVTWERHSRAVEIGVVPSFFEITKRELLKRGIPAESVKPLGVDDGTPRDAARAIKRWLEQHDDATVTYLCPRFGSRFWRNVIDDVLGKDAHRVRVVGLADSEYDESNWWHSRRGVKDVYRGYVFLLWERAGFVPEREDRTHQTRMDNRGPDASDGEVE